MYVGQPLWRMGTPFMVRTSYPPGCYRRKQRGHRWSNRRAWSGL